MNENEWKYFSFAEMKLNLFGWRLCIFISISNTNAVAVVTANNMNFLAFLFSVNLIFSWRISHDKSWENQLKVFTEEYPKEFILIKNLWQIFQLSFKVNKKFSERKILCLKFQGHAKQPREGLWTLLCEIEFPCAVYASNFFFFG